MASPHTLDTARWQRQQELFAAARELAATEREAFLAAARAEDPALAGEVGSLLAAEARAGAFLERPVARLEGEEEEDDLLTPEGRAVGPWWLSARLGRGGMGTVYLAHRADAAYEQQVAVKVLRRGLDTEDLLARFRRERQILAQLEHPAIARLLDGGTTRDGRPYLAMEHVVGVPIDRFCEGACSSLEPKIRLFRQVVAAVAFAHQNLVVHRDLKPANILVTAAGEPKLLDFGVAKLLAPEDAAFTEVGRAPFTPRYASPEQMAGGAVTTASDVYSLGVVLRDLLASPQAIPRRLPRDVEAITARALAPEREARYPSAEALGEDLDRYLAGLPLAARAGHLGERVRKFVRRHRLAVGVATLAFGALVAFTAALLLQRRQVEGERSRAAAVSSFLVELFALPDPTRSRGESITARELLGRGVAAMESSALAREPAAAAELAATMGRTYRNLGLLAEAEPLLDRALALAREAHGAAHPRLAAALQERADLAAAAGDYAKAEELSRQALTLRRTLFGETHGEVAESLTRLARAQDLGGRLEEAAVSFEAALALARRLGDRAALAAVLGRSSALLARRGRMEEAEAQLREARGLLATLHGATHPEVALADNDLALLLRRRDPEAALALLEGALRAQRHLYTEAHPHLATTLHNRGLLLAEEGRLAEAEAAYAESIALAREVYRGDHPRLAKTLTLFARLRFEQSRLSEAEVLDREAVAMAERVLAPDHLDLAEARSSLARTIAARGQTGEAEALFEAALATYRRQLGEGAEPVGTTLNNLAELAWAKGELARAESLFREALSVLRAAGEGAGARLAAVLHNLASLERGNGRLDEAEAHLREAVATTLARSGPEHPDLARLRVSLAHLLLQRGKAAEAALLARQALGVLAPLVPAADPWRESAERALREAERGNPSRPPS